VADAFTADDARHWAMLTRAALAARRSEIDGLNVFPVPDGDTGTNMYLTMDAAIEDVIDLHSREGILGTATLVDECRHLSRALLLAARGNSGVILSQIMGGICAVIIEHGEESIDAQVVAASMVRGAAAARKAVAHPQEGTILTVADAAGRGMSAAAERSGATIADIVSAGVEAAAEALAGTPDQLPALAQAGVVDAGGAGCLLMLESLRDVVLTPWDEAAAQQLGAGPGLQRRTEWYRDSAQQAPREGETSRPVRDPLEQDRPPAHKIHLHTDGEVGASPGYEVMYLLSDSDEGRVAALTAALDGLGDSLLVVGGPDLWNVHVHVNDVGAAIEAGMAAGRPHRIRVAHFATQIAALPEQGGIAVVACAAGPGIAALLEGSGAVVVTSAPGARASAGQLLAAVRKTGSSAVVILPNDKDTILAAESAARAAHDHGILTHVVPSRTAVQGLAALAVHEPRGSLHTNAVAMTSAAAATRNGAVTIASKEALTWAGLCKPGDVLGVVGGEVALLGTDEGQVAIEVLTRLLAAGGELVTLVVGVSATPELVQEVQRWLRSKHSELEVVVVEGGQPVYSLLIGVE
jgi:DAK2 domain fusion protein YloV